MGTAAIANDVLRTDESFDKADKWDYLCQSKLERDRQKSLLKAEAQQRFVEQVKSGRLQFGEDKQLSTQPQAYKQAMQTTSSSADNAGRVSDNALRIKPPTLNTSSRQLIREFSSPVLTLTKASSNIYDMSSSSINESDIMDEVKVPGATDGQPAFNKLRLIDYIVKE